MTIFTPDQKTIQKNEKVLTVPFSEPYLSEETRKQVLKALESKQYILSKQCKEFELNFSDYIGRKYGVLTNSATSAIQLALMSLGVKEGDEIIVPSLTAFPTIEPIFHVGAKPVFVDTNDKYVLNPEKIKEKITEKTKGIMPVHLYGNSCDMNAIVDIARSHNLFVFEDCAQAHGTTYQGRKVGNFGIASCFSFYPSKNLSFGGDGGIVITDDDVLQEKVRMLRNHGRKDKFIHEEIGFNMRCNEIQAAIGNVQLKSLPDFVTKRRKAATLYKELLKDTPVTLPTETENAESSYHLFVIKVPNRDDIAAKLKQKGIQTGIHYPVPCHLQPAVTKRIGHTHLPVTEETANTILSLPIFPTITEEQIRHVCDQLKIALKN
jgi:dTDP-4-amino-4,6-dideoxygalactose transaminase